MDNEPVRWSAEKQQRLADQLTGFWAEDTWLFTSKQGKTCQMRFPLAVPALRAEVKYALWTKFESGRWKGQRESLTNVSRHQSCACVAQSAPTHPGFFHAEAS
jgi:hypothetical protein